MLYFQKWFIAMDVSLRMSDISMPGVDGNEFLELYSTYQLPLQPVMMLSGSEHPKDKCMAYSFVKQYLRKPLTIENLKEIERLL